MTDLSPGEINSLIIDAFIWKVAHEKGKKVNKSLAGKVVALIFEKASLRTRVAFETATFMLGGIPIFFNGWEIFKSREAISDVAKNLENFADLVIARVDKHETIEILAKNTSIPVINALCDLHHPTQALSDMMAIMSYKTKEKGFKVAFVGDGNNVATSLMHICVLLGINFSIASADGYQIPLTEQETACKNLHDSELNFLKDPVRAVKNADVVYTDTFVSMGREAETAQRLKAFKGYQVNEKLFSHAKTDAIFMHCLPAQRGREVTDEIIDSPRSIVFDQAKCKLFMAKALLQYFLT